jgi:asparagine synthase (glutamine-hydrolysing)
MCGIAGFVRPGAAAAVARSLEESLARRGPDGSWAARRGDVSLVQTRLAVIDLSPEVSYPMPNESEDVWLLFNGEIYGYQAVRRRLEALGHRFRTACDAEVVVHAYEEWGAGCFAHLNGMFAVAILDERSGDLLLARDRFGIKPLVHTTGHTFAFSSDALSLVESGLVDGAIDMDAVEEFLQFHYVPPPKTGLEGVVSLEPGTTLVRERGGRVTTLHWAPRVFEGRAIPEGRAAGIEDLDRAMAEAVERQLVADVGVGVFLSSGIDSALLLSYAVSAGHRPLAFTVGFAGYGDYDEARRAAEVASRLGVEHHVDQFEIGFADALELVSRAFDTPLADASAIPTLLLARMARELVTVALSGTGGDELFAGYYRHRAHRIRPFATRLPKPARTALMAMAPRDAAPRRSSIQAARSYLARLAAAGAGDFAEQYLDLVTRDPSPAAQACLRFRADAAAAREAPAKRYALGDDHVGRPLDAVQEFDLKTYLPGDILVKEDRATMYSSLEARVPFLDDAVVDIAQRIPPAERASLFVGKKPLRELASQRLGAAQVTWQKRGFAVPLGQLLSGPWTEEARSWFQSLESSLVDGGRVCDELTRPNVDPTEIWALAVLGAWEQRLAEARSRAANGHR